jgi:hypothetical protein
LGRTIDVLVEGPDADAPGRWTGRGRFQAPEVDGLVRFTLPAGSAEPPAPVVRVELVAADTYDLFGKLVP